MAACAVSTATLAESSSLRGSRFFADSSFARLYLVTASASCTLVRSRSLWALLRLACDLRQVGARLQQLRVEQRGIETGDHLALLHDRIEVGAQLRDVARHLTADLDGGDRLQRPGRADRVDDVAARDGGGVHRDLGGLLAQVVRGRAPADGGNDDQNDDDAFHGVFVLKSSRRLMRSRPAARLSCGVCLCHRPLHPSSKIV